MSWQLSLRASVINSFARSAKRPYPNDPMLPLIQVIPSCRLKRPTLSLSFNGGTWHRCLKADLVGILGFECTQNLAQKAPKYIWLCCLRICEGITSFAYTSPRAKVNINLGSGSTLRLERETGDWVQIQGCGLVCAWSMLAWAGT